MSIGILHAPQFSLKTTPTASLLLLLSPSRQNAQCAPRIQSARLGSTLRASEVGLVLCRSKSRRLGNLTRSCSSSVAMHSKIAAHRLCCGVGHQARRQHLPCAPVSHLWTCKAGRIGHTQPCAPASRNHNSVTCGRHMPRRYCTLTAPRGPRIR